MMTPLVLLSVVQYTWFETLSQNAFASKEKTHVVIKWHYTVKFFCALTICSVAAITIQGTDTLLLQTFTRKYLNLVHLSVFFK